MIVSAVALLVLGLAPQDPKPRSIFAQVIENPTGRNGYEEYCQAADFARQPRITELLNASFAVGAGLRERAILVAECAPIFELIRNGNAKPVFEPRKSLGMETLFPEFASFKQVAKIYVARSYVQMARGNSDAAVASLIEGLTFADRTAQSTLIAYLVRNAMFAILYSEVGPRFGALSVPACEKLIAYGNQFFEKPEPLAICLQGETAFFEAALKELDKGGDGSFLDLGDWSKEFEQLSADSRRRLLGEAVKRHSKMLSDLVAQLDSAESTWDQPEEEKEASSLSEALIETISPAYSQTLLTTLKVRTQVRLLRLHAAIQLFRWENLSYPSTLKLLPEKYTKDPATDGTFEYTLLGNEYELFSKGTKSLGPVHLRYRSMKAVPEEVPPPKLRVRA